MAGDGQIGFNKYSSGAVRGSTQHLAQRRCRNSGAPENDRGRNLFLADRDHMIFHIGDHGIGADFNTHLA